MSRVKRFTPGPWEYQECLGRLYFEIRPQPNPSKSGLYQISDVCASKHGADKGEHIFGGEAEANAALQAAAPALLEALEDAQRRLKGYRETVAQWKRQCEPETDDLDIEDVGHLDEELAALDARIEENERIISKAYGK